MNLAHNMQPLRPDEKGYRWNRRNRRCQHCHISEDHIVTERCPILVERQRSQDLQAAQQAAQTTVDMMSSVTMEAGC